MRIFFDLFVSKIKYTQSTYTHTETPTPTLTQLQTRKNIFLKKIHKIMIIII